MTKISLNISGKVSSAHLKAISAIKKIADGLGIKFFVVGATARDFVLTCLYGVKAPRMTLDIDFGIEIKDWGSYVKIEKGLIESGQFKQTKEKQLNQDPYLEILVPTLPGLAVLKILSWKHSYPERQKDAEDLLFIINNYEHTDIMDRIFNERVEILESEAFDYKMASIRILGQDMAKICNPVTIAEVKDIFIKETSRTSQFHLVAHMMG